ncbi:MFS transporter [Rhizobium mesoamericanum]|uniref:Major facilitator superfamily MFS_1 n=1 Tax=Rhizobium mesoamericanum STM3625 TaxID=1211777 RepID=K0PIE4_9HYPH|nr:MFS transporter [Rhizobium mesoamericanum]CCM76276.1 Major facilitator superfamily MFS_1 [Rhizobium mesoamericanum STM3625]
MVDVAGSRPAALRAIPKGVWALGFVSLFMDISSEMIHALLPVYMVGILGTSAFAVGLIEGIAEATAAITKVFSGALSDWLGKRKLLVALGYGMAALTKPVFPLAPSLGWLVTARFVDRVGKGIRGAPRDALIADISPKEIRGASFGLRQSLDTVGAFLGPTLALGLMWWSADHYATVFWIAVIPAFCSVAIILFVVKEPPHAEQGRVRVPLRGSELVRLPAIYWQVVAVSAVFTLARFSEAFLILDAQQMGLAVMFVPIVLIVMNIAYGFSAYPVGVMADRVDRITLLIVGLVLLVLADLSLALLAGLVGLGIGVTLWGLHMGFTQGLLATLVADAAPAELRGTAFGIFNLIAGIALLAASLLAGALWDWGGHQMVFLAGAAFALLAGLSLLPLKKRLRNAS